MIVYMLKKSRQILRHYLKNHGNVAEFMRKMRTDIGRREAPSAPHAYYFVKKSERNWHPYR